MRVIREGDRVQVHYMKRYQDGSVVSSRGRVPAELTIGTHHPRMPGLGLMLVGMAVGESRTLLVPAKQAYDLCAPGRTYRLARAHFAGPHCLAVGEWVRVWDSWKRRRLVRIVEVREKVVVVDTNRHRAAQSLELQVELIAIHGPEATPGPVGGYPPDCERDLRLAFARAEAGWQGRKSAGGKLGNTLAHNGWLSLAPAEMLENETRN